MLIGAHRMFTGTAGTHFQGVRRQAKNGGTPSPSWVPGGKTRTVRLWGGGVPCGVAGAEKVKRARCLGMFQFRRPL